MSGMESQHDLDQATRATVEQALAGLREDPLFVQHLEHMQHHVRESLVAAGIPEDQIELTTGGGKSTGGTAERVPPGHVCLLMLFDECWFSIKIY